VICPVSAATAPSPTTPPKRGLAFGASAAFVAQIATVVLQAATSVVIARMFGPSGNGTFALIGNLFAAMVLLAGIGLPTGITYVVSRGRWPLRSAFVQTQRFGLLLGALGGLVGFAFYAATSGSVFKGLHSGAALAAMVAVPFGMAAGFAASLALAVGRYAQYAWVQVARAVLSLVVVVAFAIPFDIEGAIVGFAVAQVLTAVIAAAALSRTIHTNRTAVEPVAASAHPLSEASSFGLKAFGADVLQFLNYRLDIFLVGAFATATDVGHYSVAVSLTMIGWLLPAALQQVLLPRAAELSALADAGELSHEDADRSVTRVIRHTAILQIPTGILLAALLLVGVPLLYGSAFHETILLGFLLLPGVLVLSVGKVISSVVTGRGRPIYALYTTIVTMPVTILLYVLLIPPIGAEGAAIGSSLSYILSTALAVWYLRRVMPTPLRVALTPRRDDFATYLRAPAQLRARIAAARR
jgi:O-antigen/teichoic acid export membrane protein